MSVFDLSKDVCFVLDVDGSMYERLCMYAISLNRHVVDALPFFCLMTF